jgi:16S rRNA (guanine527-N7)-methyltransferase
VTEDEARAWLAARFPGPGLDRLERYVEMLLAENSRQNLISRQSESEIWARHIVDSAQLIEPALDAASWLDVGSGPGLPGLVIASLVNAPVTLVEPRSRRVGFLRSATDALGLANVVVHPCMIAQLPAATYGAVTARAYAPLADLLPSIAPFTDSSTIWVLPKGRSAETELAAARETWQGVFHVKQSATSVDARIIVARKVRRKRS